MATPRIFSQNLIPFRAECVSPFWMCP